MISKHQRTNAMTVALAAVDAKTVELVVGWRKGNGWDGATMPITKTLATGLLAACGKTVRDAQAVADPKAFDVDTSIGPGELMVARTADFPDIEVGGDGDRLLELLNKATIGETLKPEDLKQKVPKINFYAARLKAASNPDEWVVFLNRADPQISTRPGSFLALFGKDKLDAVNAPVFQFRRSFDMFVVSALVFTAGFGSFDSLFRQVVIEQTGEMVSQLAARLPKSLKLDASSVDLLNEQGRARPRLRTRLRSLLAKPYLGTLTVEMVKTEATRQKLKGTDFLKSGKLFVDPKRPTRLINLLDEALARGGFSGVLFEVEHRARLD